jgi:transposase
MVMETREERGIELAEVARITRQNGVWIVPSQSGNGKYKVSLGTATEAARCTCPDYETRGVKCKHIFAVECVIRRETTDNGDGSITVTDTVSVTATKRTTYAQDWTNYNEAQTNEKRQLQSLLFDLCGEIQEPAQGKGRPRLPLRDAVFAVTFKIYSTVSGRRFISDLCEAQAKGYIRNVPHFNSIFNYLDHPMMTPTLTALIVRSSLPLRAVETDFAVDSTGFTTSRFVRWFDHKYGAVRQEHDWVKAHMMCGVKTNIVTAVEIHGRDAQDSPILPSLLATTARNFNVSEVSADKGYSSINNADVVASYGAMPFIAYKAGHTGKGGGVWEKMFHFFSYQRETFLAHYHKRSNVESTVNMIKAKFSDHVRSKTDLAMKNEVLCKVLCHNICCLIHAMYELGISPAFVDSDATSG